MEAMPYLKKYAGKVIVIKYGGNAMINEELKAAVLQDVVMLKLLGMKPVLSHGGGPGINKMLEKLDIPRAVHQRPALHLRRHHPRGGGGAHRPGEQRAGGPDQRHRRRGRGPVRYQRQHL